MDSMALMTGERKLYNPRNGWLAGSRGVTANAF